jgi:N-acyl-D-aspartate/D-glutamate deacylase
MAQWDLLIRGAKVFDGEGTPGRIEDVAVANGNVVARGASLPASQAKQCVDAAGKVVDSRYAGHPYAPRS